LTTLRYSTTIFVDWGEEWHITELLIFVESGVGYASWPWDVMNGGTD
jgi:hypothetical protein